MTMFDSSQIKTLYIITSCITTFSIFIFREKKRQETINMVDQPKTDDSNDKEAQELTMPDHDQ